MEEARFSPELTDVEAARLFLELTDEEAAWLFLEPTDMEEAQLSLEPTDEEAAQLSLKLTDIQEAQLFLNPSSNVEIRNISLHQRALAILKEHYATLREHSRFARSALNTDDRTDPEKIAYNPAALGRAALGLATHPGQVSFTADGINGKTLEEFDDEYKDFKDAARSIEQRRQEMLLPSIEPMVTPGSHIVEEYDLGSEDGWLALMSLRDIPNEEVMMPLDELEELMDNFDDIPQQDPNFIEQSGSPVDEVFEDAHKTDVGARCAVIVKKRIDFGVEEEGPRSEVSKEMSLVVTDSINYEYDLEMIRHEMESSEE